MILQLSFMKKTAVIDAATRGKCESRWSDLGGLGMTSYDLSSPLQWLQISASHYITLSEILYTLVSRAESPPKFSFQCNTKPLIPQYNMVGIPLFLKQRFKYWPVHDRFNVHNQAGSSDKQLKYMKQMIIMKHSTYSPIVFST